MHVEFDPDSSIDWASVFADQVHSVQNGSGFHGYPYQRGASGLGGLVSKLLGYVLPLAKRMGRSIGTEALLASGRIAEDLSSGEGFTNSLKRRGRDSYDNLVTRAVSKLQKGEGSTKHKKTPVRRKNTKSSSTKTKGDAKSKKEAAKKKITRKRRAKDIFTLWEAEK